MPKSITKNAIYNILYNLMNIAFPLVYASYIARILQPEGVGLIAIVNNIASYFTTAAPLGIPTYGIKVIAKVSIDNRSKSFSELFVINMISTILFSVVYYTFICLPRFEENRILYCIAGIAIILNVFNIDWLYRGLEEYQYITIRNFLIKIMSLAGIFIFVHKRDDVIVYMLLTCAVNSINQVINFYHSRKFVRLCKIELKEACKRHLKPIVFLLISLIAGEIYLKMDVTMLGLLCQSANVGYYSQALKIINIIIAVIASLTAVSLSKLAELKKCGLETELWKLVNKILGILFTISMPAFIGMLFVAEDLVLLFFGAKFLPAANVIRILALLFIVRGIGDLLAYQLVVAIDKEKILVPVRIMSVFFNGILNYCLIIKYAENGAAIATVATEAFTLCYVLFVTRKTYKLKVKTKLIISLVISNLVMLITLLAITKLVDNHMIHLVISTVLGIAAYGLALFISKNEYINEIINRLMRGRNKQRMRRSDE